ncbi:MAG: ATP-binding protein [Acidobacteriota bacterium]
MARHFNTAGICRPEDHYMLAPEARLGELRQLVDAKAYFVIHAPRQSGKTTGAQLLAEALTAEGKYAAVLASCKPGAVAGGDVDRGIRAVVGSIDQECGNQLPAELRPESPDALRDLAAEIRLKEYLKRWCEQCPRPVVLFLDEIDALIDDTLLSVLDQLHAGYPSRPSHSPHSLGLIGLRDVRDYRISRQVELETRREGLGRIGSSSPFNIKSDSLTLRNFNAGEVAELYEQHTAETGQEFSAEAKARAFELTAGQPWLTNAMARQLVEKLVCDRSVMIDTSDVEVAKEVLIRRRDTHLDSLIDRLREDRVRKVIEPILTGNQPRDDVFDDDIQFVKDLGLVAPGSGMLEIANPIYREIIPRALTSATEAFLPLRHGAYVASDGRLLWNELLDGFTAFWKSNAEWMLRRQPYSEAAAQLVLSAWLHRVVNGGAEIEARPAGVAAIDREYAVGSGRVDLLVRWPLPDGSVERFAAELKVRRDGDSDPLETGLDQLCEYLDRLGLDTGTLVLFDQREQSPPIGERCSRETVEHRSRQIIVLRL